MVPQCPTKRTIVLKGKDLYTSQEESSSSDSDTSHSSDSQEHSYPNEGKLLMIRRLLNNQPSLSDEAIGAVDRRKWTPFDRDGLRQSFVRWKRLENVAEDRLLK